MVTIHGVATYAAVQNAQPERFARSSSSARRGPISVFAITNGSTTTEVSDRGVSLDQGLIRPGGVRPLSWQWLGLK